MNGNRFTWLNLQNALITILVLFAAWYIFSFIVLGFFRLPYPFDLEWLEGAMVDQVVAMLNSSSIYEEPNIENLPFPYTPFYFFLSTVFSYIFGVGYFPLRLISYLSTLGCLILIYKFVAKETDHKISGIVAAGLFAATYSINAYWFDLARVDMLFLVLLLGSAFIVRHKTSALFYAIAGILMFLAFMTKQSAIFVNAAIAGYILVYHRKLLVYFLLTSIGFSILSCLFLNYCTEGWFIYYTMIVTSDHGVLGHRLSSFWTFDVLDIMILPSLLCIYSLLELVNNKRWKSLSFWAIIFLSFTLISYLGRIKSGGANNTLIPMHSIMCILAGFAVAYASNIYKTKNISSLGILISFILIFQFSFWLYNPTKFVPPQAGMANGYQALDIISKYDGKVWFPSVGYMTTRSGKSQNAHLVLVKELVKEKKNKSLNTKRLLTSFRKNDYKAVIVNEPDLLDIFKTELKKNYTKQPDTIKVTRWQAKDGWKIDRESLYIKK